MVGRTSALGVLISSITVAVSSTVLVSATETSERTGLQIGASSDTSSVDHLRWFAGCWEAQLPGDIRYEEVWLPPSGGMMLGVSRAVREGHATQYEFLRIALAGEQLVYYAAPSGRSPTAFAAEETGETHAVFTNPKHDFPTEIRYRVITPDSLLAEIEGMRDGGPYTIAFPFARAACPS